MAIFNKYKDTLDDIIDSLDPKTPLKLIHESFCNTPYSKENSTSLLEKNYLNKNILALDRSLKLAPKTEHLKLHQHCDITLFDFKNN